MKTRYDKEIDAMSNSWEKIGEEKLEKQFEFEDFKTALDFVNKVGKIAERLQHHPDISIKDYKYVLISTSTHDAGNKITEKDYTLAENIDSL